MSPAALHGFRSKDSRDALATRGLLRGGHQADNLADIMQVGRGTSTRDGPYPRIAAVHPYNVSRNGVNRSKSMIESFEMEPGKFAIRATVRRLGIYLDNYAIIGFATGDVARRDRLIGVFQGGADLMFSPASAAEIIGPDRPNTIAAVRDFLDSVGPYWFPVEGTDLVGILEREAAGADRSDACLSTWFIQQFFAGRSIQIHGEQRQALVSPDYFRLGFILDWLGPHRADIRRRVDAFDVSLASKLVQLRRAYEQNRNGFDLHLPEPKWEPSPGQRPSLGTVWSGD
jgi:hypothetical protein